MGLRKGFHYTDRKLPCPVCSRIFKNKQALEQHRRGHVAKQMMGKEESINPPQPLSADDYPDEFHINTVRRMLSDAQESIIRADQTLEILLHYKRKKGK